MTSGISMRPAVAAAAAWGLVLAGLASGALAAAPGGLTGQAATAAWQRYGKPRAPVTVSLAPGQSAFSGVPLTLTLDVQPRVPVSNLRLVIRGDAGLDVTAVNGAAAVPDGTPAVASAGPGGASSYAIGATPLSGGTWELSGVVTFEVDGVAQAAPFAVSVPVGGPVTMKPVQAKPAPRPVRDSKGELVDSMPAETTVEQ